MRLATIGLRTSQRARGVAWVFTLAACHVLQACDGAGSSQGTGSLTPTAKQVLKKVETPAANSKLPTGGTAPGLTDVFQALPKEFTTDENKTLTFSLKLDTLKDEDWAFSCTEKCPAGLSVETTTGVIKWTPTYSQAGEYPDVTFSAKKSAQTLTRSVKFVVNNVNAPVELAAIEAKTVNEGTRLSFQLQATDADDEAITYGCFSGCPTGLFVEPGTGFVRWTPGYDQAGNYSVLLTALSTNSSSTQSVNISVTNVPRPPQFAFTAPNGGQNYTTAPLTQILSGTCSQDVLSIQSNVAGTIANDCAGSGSFSFVFTPSTTTQVTLTATGKNQESKSASVQVSIDNTPPQVSITSPNAGKNWTTDSAQASISGRCSTDTARLTVTPSNLNFSDANCSDGTWSLQSTALTPLQKLAVSVQAFDAAGNSTTQSISISRSVVVGQVADYAHRKLAENFSNSSYLNVFGDGQRLAVVDAASHRVLIWNQLPTASGIPPDVVLGQPDFAQTSLNNGGLSTRSLSTPRAVFWDSNRFYVSDSGNHRVLVWNSFPTQNFQAADLVLGQPGFLSNLANDGGPSASTFKDPGGIWSDGVKLYIADSSNNRVLGWNSPPTANGTPADFVLGQTNFNITSSNTGGRSASTFQFPFGITGTGNRLFIVDQSNYRVLVWNTLPSANATPADIVLGQSNFTNAVGGTSQTAFNFPLSVHTDGTRLFLADRISHRVLVWNSLPTATAEVPSLVLGQSSFTAATTNSGATMSGVTLSSKGFSAPSGVVSDGTQLFVADGSNARVLRFPIASLATYADADLVMGRKDFTSRTTFLPGLQRGLSLPYGVLRWGNRLIVADSANNRVLIWNTVPASGAVPPDVILGQSDHFSTTCNAGGISASSLCIPRNPITDGTRLMVSDSSNNRVLIWNSLPTANNAPADVVVGQASMTSSNAASNATGLSGPNEIDTDGTRLVVPDSNNNRVLIWNTIPTVNGTAADIVLGQANFTTGTANAGGATSDKAFYVPVCARFIGSKLAVCDAVNNRVLIWNSIPTANYTAADIVLGQPNFTANTCHTGGQSASTLCVPQSVASNGTKLVVSDNNSNRILIWNSLPTQNQQAANLVIGQNDFYSSISNTGAIQSTQGLASPSGVHIYGNELWVADRNNNYVKAWFSFPQENLAPADLVLGAAFVQTGFVATDAKSIAPSRAIRVQNKLIVADSGRNRVLIWNTAPTSNNQPADVVIGQPNMSGILPNAGGLSAHSLFNPMDVASDGTRLAIADTGNNRILIYNSIPTASNQDADLVIGQSQFISALPNIGGIGANTLNTPRAVLFAEGKLLVTDSGNHRVLIFSTIPTSNFMSADVVVGQTSFAGKKPNWQGVSHNTLLEPYSTLILGGKMFVADTGNHRVLIWNTVPTVSGTGADDVLGQVDLYKNTSNFGSLESSLSLPRGLAGSGDTLFVSDSSNNRILVWKGIPSSTFAPAQAVLGQKSLYTTGSAVTSSEVHILPLGLSVDGQVLLISSQNQERVLMQPLP